MFRVGIVSSEACVHLHGLWVGDTVKYPSQRGENPPPQEFDRVRLIDSPNDLEAEGEVIGVRAERRSDRIIVQVRLLEDPREYVRR